MDQTDLKILKKLSKQAKITLSDLASYLEPIRQLI